MSSQADWLTTMTEDDQYFFEQLGLRIATLRKAQRLNQTQLAKVLKVSQQHMASFEKGQRKIPASLLPALAQVFAISVDELMGASVKASKRGPTPKLQQQLERISNLPRTKQQFVIQMLDTVLQQAS